VLFPQLFSLANPQAPHWGVPVLDAVEIPGLLQSIVMFVGRESQTGQLRILGSGFVIAVGSIALVVSAAHVFVDWTNAVRPAKKHSLAGIAGDAEDFIQRIKPLLVSGDIKAVLNFDDPVGGRLCGIEWISSDADPTQLDVAAIPSLPGMSGGPVILDRNFEAQSTALIQSPPTLPLTAVGVVSRSRIGSPLLMDSCPEGDTWLSPISKVRQLILPASTGAMTLGEAVDSGAVPSFKP
jgi:hypothetical protein